MYTEMKAFPLWWMMSLLSSIHDNESHKFNMKFQFPNSNSDVNFVDNQSALTLG
jgi:hypothetical protein